MRELRAGSTAPPSSDRGAITAVLAVLLGTGLLLGLLALSFDTGLLYLERSAVGSAADSSATGLARDCALNAANCATVGAADAFAEQLADANSPDGASAVEEACGRSGKWTQACAALTTRQMDCRTLGFPDGRTMAANHAFVRVTTATETDTGGLAIFPVFAGLLDRDAPDPGGVTLWSCGQAVWGKSARVPVLFPIALPICRTFTIDAYPPTFIQDGAGAATTSCTTPPPAAVNQVQRLILGVDGVPTYQGFSNVMLNLRWISGFDCVTPTTVTAGSMLTIYTGAPGSLCGSTLWTRLQAAITAGRPILLPMGGSSTTTTVEARAFAAFVPVGYYWRVSARDTGSFGTAPPGGWTNTCTKTNNKECLWGWFSRVVVPREPVSAASTTTIPNMGVQAVELLP